MNHIDQVVHEFNDSRGAHVSYGRDLTAVNKACIARLKADPEVNEVWMVGTCIKYNLKAKRVGANPSKTFRVENPLATDRVAMRISQDGPHWYTPYSGNHGQTFRHEEDVEVEERSTMRNFMMLPNTRRQRGQRGQREKQQGEEKRRRRRGKREKQQGEEKRRNRRRQREK